MDLRATETIHDCGSSIFCARSSMLADMRGNTGDDAGPCPERHMVNGSKRWGQFQ
jgi:hypothetical protein